MEVFKINWRICGFKGYQIFKKKEEYSFKIGEHVDGCANTCNYDAIKIELDDLSRLDEIIGKIETYVDVKDQVKAKS